MIDAVVLEKIKIYPNGHEREGDLYSRENGFTPTYYYNQRYMNIAGWSSSIDKNTFTVEFSGDTSKFKKVRLKLTYYEKKHYRVSSSIHPEWRHVVEYEKNDVVINLNRVGDSNVFSYDYYYPEDLSHFIAHAGSKSPDSTGAYRSYVYYKDLGGYTLEEAWKLYNFLEMAEDPKIVGVGVQYYGEKNRKLDMDYLRSKDAEIQGSIDDLSNMVELFDDEYSSLSADDKNEVNTLLAEAFEGIEIPESQNNLVNNADGSVTAKANDSDEAVTTKKWIDETKTAEDLLNEGYQKLETYGNEEIYSYSDGVKNIVADLSDHSFVCYSIDEQPDDKAPNSSGADINLTQSSFSWRDAMDVSALLTDLANTARKAGILAKKINSMYPNAGPICGKILGRIAGFFTCYSTLVAAMDCESLKQYWDNKKTEIYKLEVSLGILEKHATEKGCAQSELANLREALNKAYSEWKSFSMALFTSASSLLATGLGLLAAFSLLPTGGGFAVSALISVLTAVGGVAAGEYANIKKNELNRATDNAYAAYSAALAAMYNDGCEVPTTDPNETIEETLCEVTEEVSFEFDEELKPIEDPAGFVCEAVESNKLEGVKATLYFSEYEDGKDAEIWDAEDFGQQNPLYTDAHGAYQWYVPDGYWQVKYEKEGYETLYSDWLPVPPPQLDVNVCLVSLDAPEVKNVKTYSDSIDITFSQYMDIASVNSDTVKVTIDDEEISGTIKATNEEAAYKQEGVKYASKFTFTPDSDDLYGEVKLYISGANNYADTAMAAPFSETQVVEGKVEKITADEKLTINYGEPKKVKISLSPSDAGANKTVNVTVSNDLLLSADKTKHVTDENGEAELTLDVLLPGETNVMYQLEGTDVTAYTQILGTNIVEQPTTEPELPKLEKVTASVESGTKVKKGTQITLTCPNPDAKIYYTLDMSCPCQEDNEARTLYTSPITVSEDAFIIAYAVLDGYAPSTNASFSYTIETETKPTDPTEPTEPSAPAKISISKCKITGIKAKTYTGKAIKQSVKVTYNGKPATFKITYKNNKNAGKATMVITGTGKFNGKVTKTFKIAKANNPMKVTFKKTVKANASKKTSIKNTVTVKKAQGKLVYKTNNKKFTIKNDKLNVGKCTLIVDKGLKKGKTYTVKITVTSKGSANYKSIKKTVKVKVKIK